MPPRPEHIAGHTVHARRGAIGNAFRYGVDYVLIDPDSRAARRCFRATGSTCQRSMIATTAAPSNTGAAPRGRVRFSPPKALATCASRF